MKIPTVGSKIRIKVPYFQGPKMIPPRPDFSVYEGTVLSPYKWLTPEQFCLSNDDPDWPIRVINAGRILEMDIINGTAKSVNSDLVITEVKGSKGDIYIVTRNKGNYTCTCQGFQWRKSCKHITSQFNKKEGK